MANPLGDRVYEALVAYKMEFTQGKKSIGCVQPAALADPLGKRLLIFSRTATVRKAINQALKHVRSFLTVAVQLLQKLLKSPRQKTDQIARNQRNLAQLFRRQVARQPMYIRA